MFNERTQPLWRCHRGEGALGWHKTGCAGNGTERACEPCPAVVSAPVPASRLFCLFVFIVVFALASMKVK